MLVLTRKKDQALIIGDKIVITVLDIKGDQVRIGIDAPKDITILRQEIYLEIKKENEQAIYMGEHSLGNLAKIIKESINDSEKLTEEDKHIE